MDTSGKVAMEEEVSGLASELADIRHMLNSATTYTPTATDTTTNTTTTTSLDLAADGHLTEQTDVTEAGKTRVVRLIRDIERTAAWQLGVREDMTEQNGRQSLSASLPLLKCHSQGV